MIQFKVSAPSRISLFGEHAVKYGKKGLMAGIDLRTTLTFTELSHSPLSSNIKIDFPQMHIYLDVSFQEFLKFYNDCVENIELLREQVLRFTNYGYNPAHRRVIIQTFYYLLVYIIYKEQIEIKSFNMHLYTELMINEEFACPASFTVCLSACLIHWSRLQKGAHDTFDTNDLEKIQLYAACYEELFSESGIVDVTACIYGSVVEYQIGGTIRLTSLLEIPSMKILLIDSKITQNLESQTQRMTEMMNMYPETVNSLLNNIDSLTSIAYNVFRRLIEIYKDNELDIETRRECIFYQQIALSTSVRFNHILLNLLNISHVHLNRISAIAQKYGLFGKYTDIGNGRYAYIWLNSSCDHLSRILVILLSLELKRIGYHVTETNLARIGVRIESITC